MEIRINKQSEVPVRKQLAEQIIYLIATQKLKPGETLPSIREFARRLRIHRNTVSQAYADLKRRAWLVSRRGSRVVVQTRGSQSRRVDVQDLDDLINATIRIAREQGFTLQTLRERVRTRLLAQPPDRILVVEEEPALRMLLQHEICTAINRPVEGCSLSDLARDRGLAIGALPATPQYAINDLEPLLPKVIPAIPLTFSAADEQVELLQKLSVSSVIALVSISEAFLKTGQSLLAPIVGRHHSLLQFRFPVERPTCLKAVDLVFADSVVYHQIRHPQVIRYRLIRRDSLEYLVDATKSYESPP